MERIADLVEKIERGTDLAEVREDARTLVAEVIAYHRAGLEKLVAALPSNARGALEDPLVASLIELHGLAPPAEPPAAEPLLPVSGLLRKATKKQSDVAREHETCELCAAPVAARHAHVIEVASGVVRCACIACAVLFDSTAGQRHRRIPDDVLAAPSLATDDGWWTALGLPVGLAFIVPRDGGGAVVRYPGPAGATESSLDAATWTRLVEAHPVLARVVPEVQALLVDRFDGSREHWVVGVDRCWELVARVREHWHGMTGGDGVRAELRRFIEGLAA